MRRLAMFAAIVLAAAVGAGIAVATLTPTTVVDTNVVREKVVRNQFTPSADQPRLAVGWHIHPGLAIVQVQEGRLTIFQNCQRFTLGPGRAYIEVPYLPVSAAASGPVKWTTTFVLADSTAGPSSPTQMAATEPSCPGIDVGSILDIVGGGTP
jgi:AraC-like protein